MDLNRLWVLGSVVLIAATALLGWVLGISPKLSEAGLADADRVAVETQNSASALKVAALKEKFDSIGDLKGELSALRMAVPNAAEIPAFVTQLDSIAEQHQVTLTDISVNDAQAYVPLVVAPTAIEAPAADASAPTATTAPTATAAPTAAEVAAALAPVPNALITASNFVSVPISLSVSGSYGNVLDFIEGLQKGTRLVMVTTFATTPAEASSSAAPVATNSTTVQAPIGSDQVTTTISALIYVLLNPAAATPATGAPVPAE
ncbi:hypothetical protein [Cryobacterium sp. TMT2-23]|uniref:hypothetical protein n=1 Tax=Cryobacterium sp. TMT2-23 TaxID=1259252 RepID=UPI001068E17A|nr:hypothetical protein [Cryobacterium sp. TMT2-23]TFD17171.1 hypothetical protein E3T32_14285 [Cryobacterium sp. TMT2-23]